MSMANRKRKTRRGKGSGGRGGPGCLSIVLLFLFVLVAAVATIMIFFSVRTINVVGNSKYTAEDIRTHCDVKVGDNLILFNKFKVIGRLFEALPYVEEIGIYRDLPGTLQIEVTESHPMGNIVSGSDTWLISAGAKLLERLPPFQEHNTIDIEGTELISPVEGATASLEKDDTIKLDALVDTLAAIVEMGIEKDVTVVDISKVYNIEFEYLGRFIVKLGMPENIDYKLEYLEKIVNELEVNQTGIIDLSELIDNEIARFIPFDG